MDYCDCGQASVARCVDCKVPLCEIHSSGTIRVDVPLKKLSDSNQRAVRDEIAGRHICASCVDRVISRIALTPEKAFVADRSATWWSEVQGAERDFDQISQEDLPELYEYLRSRLSGLSANEVAQNWLQLARNQIPHDGIATEKTRGMLSNKPFEYGYWQFRYGGNGSSSSAPGTGVVGLRDVAEWPKNIIKTESVLAPPLANCADVVELAMQMALRVRDRSYPRRAYFVQLPGYVGSFSGPWPRFGSF